MLCMARRVNYRDVIHNRDDSVTKIKTFNVLLAFKRVGYQCSGTRRANSKDNLCAIALLFACHLHTQVRRRFLAYFFVAVAYMDVGKGREHAYRDIDGRVMQEQLPRSGSFDKEVGHQKCLHGCR